MKTFKEADIQMEEEMIEKQINEVGNTKDNLSMKPNNTNLVSNSHDSNSIQQPLLNNN